MACLSFLLSLPAQAVQCLLTLEVRSLLPWANASTSNNRSTHSSQSISCCCCCCCCCWRMYCYNSSCGRHRVSCSALRCSVETIGLLPSPPLGQQPVSFPLSARILKYVLSWWGCCALHIRSLGPPVSLRLWRACDSGQITESGGYACVICRCIDTLKSCCCCCFADKRAPNLPPALMDIKASNVATYSSLISNELVQ